MLPRDLPQNPRDLCASTPSRPRRAQRRPHPAPAHATTAPNTTANVHPVLHGGSWVLDAVRVTTPSGSFVKRIPISDLLPTPMATTQAAQTEAKPQQPAATQPSTAPAAQPAVPEGQQPVPGISLGQETVLALLKNLPSFYRVSHHPVLPLHVPPACPYCTLCPSSPIHLDRIPDPSSAPT